VAHHLGRATRYGLTVGWLTAPSRAVAVLFGGLLRSIVRQLPTARAVACTRTRCGWWRNTASFPTRFANYLEQALNEAAFDSLAADRTAI
jgi:hypothetical protein